MNDDNDDDGYSKFKGCYTSFYYMVCNTEKFTETQLSGLHMEMELGGAKQKRLDNLGWGQ